MIRPALPQDSDSIWRILEPVIREGETYALDRDMTRETGLEYWTAPVGDCFVYEIDGDIVGSYFIRPNQTGGGAHVGNCGYIVANNRRGSGIARHMGEHSIVEAQIRGYRAIQFNFVIITNLHAVNLWESLDFEIIGRLPNAFESPSSGFVDALVMFREV